MTTVADESRPTVTRTFWYDVEVPVMVTVIGSVTSVRPGIETYVVSSAPAHANALGRSTGIKAEPTGEASAAPSAPIKLSCGEVTCTSAPPGSASGSNSALARLIGVKRHSSSRPVGRVKSAGSKEVTFSALFVGTLITISRSIGSVVVAEPISRRPLPSVAR